MTPDLTARGTVRVRSRRGERVEMPCGYCHAPVFVRPKKSTVLLSAYCSREHYYAKRRADGAGSATWRYGSMLARAVVAQHFALKPKHIVHHEDRDERNNDLRNLWVFASHSDHMKHHHGASVMPIWKGSDLRP